MKFLLIAFKAVLIILAIVLLVISLLGFLPLENYFIDQFAQLRLCWLVGAAAVALVAFFFRSRVAVAIAATTMLINGIICGASFLPQQQGTAGATIKVVAANIWGARQKKYDEFVALIRREQPDVVVVLEYTYPWLKELRANLFDYPHQIEEGLSGGAAIFSRLPIEQIETKKPRRFGVRGWINIGDRKVLLIGSHPPAPSDAKRWEVRNRELARLAEDVKHADAPVIITGDLNCTPWSMYFQRLLAHAGVLDSQQGRGPQPSWSTQHFLLVPIDHALHTPDLVVTERRTGPDIGSDHLPIIFVIGLNRNAVN